MLVEANKKVLLIIIGCLRPGFIEDIRSWEPIINIFKNIEILYVIKDRINLLPQILNNSNDIHDMYNRRCAHWRGRLFGHEANKLKLNEIEDFIYNTGIEFKVSYDDCYSRPVDCNFLYETLPFFTTKKSSLLLLDNGKKLIDNTTTMFYSWNMAYEYIINNNIDFDYCIKIRPDIITNATPEMFSDILNYCAHTEHLIVNGLWKQGSMNDPYKYSHVNDQFAMGTKKNIMIYLNTPSKPCDCHLHLLEYLMSNNITLAKGGGFTKISLKSWELQHNRYFKDFLYKNIDREHYEAFIMLLTQLSNSS